MNHLFLFGSCIAIGAASGFLGGLLGIGGGVVIVPGLIILFDAWGLFPPQTATPVAVATSLASIIFVSSAAGITQMRARMVDWQVVRRWTVFLVIGSFLASSVAVLLPVAVFRSLIGLFLLFVATVMLTSWKPSPHRTFPGRVISGVLGSAGGLISGLAGIGGGNVVVPTLLYFNIPVHRATATSSTLGIPIALAGTRGYVVTGWNQVTPLDASQSGWMLGYVYVPCFLAVVAATVATAPVGVKLAHRLSPQPLRRAFGILLIFVAARMLYSALTV